MTPGKRTAAASRDTRALILEAARELFNDRGTGSTSTNHIAQAAGISVGNLYYHFKDRDEIVFALFEAIRSECAIAFQIPADHPLDLTLFHRMIRANYEILWRYRFFYRELNVLLRHNLALATEFRNFRANSFASFKSLVTAYGATGVMRPVNSPEELDSLTEMVWLVSEYYLLFLEAHEAVDAEAFIARGIDLLGRVLEPYLTVTHLGD